MNRFRPPALVAFVLVVGGSASILYGNCNVVPHDEIAENGFGAAAGFYIEYCGLIQPPPDCTVDGWYFPVTQGTSFTRTGGQTTLTYTSVIREAVDAPLGDGSEIFPGPPRVSGTAMASNIPTFPNSSIHDEPFVLPPIIRPHFSCAGLDGSVSPEIFILEDRTPATPFNPGFGSSNGSPFEDLTGVSGQYRALGTSAIVTPFAAQLDGSQVVPTDPTNLTGRAQVDWSGHIDIQIPSLSGSSADIRIAFGQAGANGPILCSFSNADIPFSGQCPDLGTTHLIPLITAKIYAEVDADGPSEGVVTIRGQVMPANFLFMDGFETGVRNRWSANSGPGHFRGPNRNR